MGRTHLFRFLMIVVFTFSMLLTGCSHIADENGEENISLVHITQDMMIRDSYGSTSTGSCNSSMSTSNYIKSTLKINKFSGVDDLEEFEIYTSTNFKYEYKVFSGNFGMILLKDDQFYCDLVNEMHEFSDSIVLTPGEYEIVIAGETAKFEISFTIER